MKTGTIHRNFPGTTKNLVRQCLVSLFIALPPNSVSHFPTTLTWKTPASKTTAEANACLQHISAPDDLELWK